jgi:hypothetical protein
MIVQDILFGISGSEYKTISFANFTSIDFTASMFQILAFRMMKSVTIPCPNMEARSIPVKPNRKYTMKKTFKNI